MKNETKKKPAQSTLRELEQRWAYVIGQIERADFAISNGSFLEALDDIEKACSELRLCTMDLHILSEHNIADERYGKAQL